MNDITLLCMKVKDGPEKSGQYHRCVGGSSNSSSSSSSSKQTNKQNSTAMSIAAAAALLPSTEAVPAAMGGLRGYNKQEIYYQFL